MVMDCRVQLSCAILATEKSGMPNAQIAIGLREKNSRSSEKEIQRSRI
jgi:hypothetical protein